MNKNNKTTKRLVPFLSIGICFAILLGVFYVTRDELAPDAKQIHDIVEKDAESRGLTGKGIVVSHELLKSMGKYEEDSPTPYDYEEWESQNIQEPAHKQIHRIMSDEHPNWEALAWYASMNECEYLAYPDEKAPDTELASCGYEKIGSTENYDIYHHNEEENYDESWLVTQYGDPNGNQLMFYTLQNQKGDFIVVDGGWTTDAEFVKQTLTDLGSYVDAWIITHPHSDHVGAFCEIYRNPGKLKIDRVYSVDMAPPELCLENASWDDMSAYEDWLTLDISQLTYVYSGDQFEIEGLDFHVLSAYEDVVDVISNDLLNDGSMMFKVTAEEETMLFCADVGINMTDHILNSVGGEQLKADYMQIGHHGNGGLADYFYRYVNPKATFFDAPNWLMEDPEDRFTTPEHKQLMLDMGSEVYSFSTAPNQFMLE